MGFEEEMLPGTTQKRTLAGHFLIPMFIRKVNDLKAAHSCIIRPTPLKECQSFVTNSRITTRISANKICSLFMKKLIAELYLVI